MPAHSLVPSIEVGKTRERESCTFGQKDVKEETARLVLFPRRCTFSYSVLAGASNRDVN